MAPLNDGLRRELAKRVVDAREVAEQGAQAALARLAVADKEPHGHLTPDERILRNRLRARARALGDPLRPNGVQELDRLVEEVAYEAWHRMLFARFLAENGLLVHPEHGVPVTLAECEELAPEEGAEDQWVLASRYAARMLPQIFRPDDPALQVVFAPEHRAGLERLLEALAPEVFRADDSLGWVYQFWQAKKKDEVNAAGEPITGETLPAVTQLFTEPYMVSFLLENTIGAWWAGRHPGETPPVKMPYLRRLEDGTPAAGTFDGWPKTWPEFTLLDPCCGSGHFLVAALRLIVPLRMHDEGLDAVSAVDAVLRENLHGLELDARCTQIAAFAVALAAWTTPGATGYRPLPELQIACSGLAVAAKREEWVALAEGDQRLGAALGRLHDLFRLAPELGSLIDPTEGAEDLLTASFAEVRPLLERALTSGRVRRDEQREATAVAAQGVAKAAELASRKYAVTATNVPFLGREKQSDTLKAHLDKRYSSAKYDLATAFVVRALHLTADGGTAVLVTPQYWSFLTRYAALRRLLLNGQAWRFIAKLGPRAFATIGGEVVNVMLLAITRELPRARAAFLTIDATAGKDATEKMVLLRRAQVGSLLQAEQIANPDHVLGYAPASQTLLNQFATSYQGLATSDNPQFVQCFWERPRIDEGWVPFQFAPESTAPVGGTSYILHWEDGRGRYYRHAMGLKEIGLLGGWKSGGEAWGKAGVAVNRMSGLPVSLYSGDKFDCNTAVIVPNRPEYLPAIWAYCSSSEFHRDVRALNQKLSVTNATLAKVPFDLERWTAEAARQLHDGVPPARSANPTQLPFHGSPAQSERPLQVAVARLLGYEWPRQSRDEPFDIVPDEDGIVCIPSVRGERPAAERLLEVLRASFGDALTSEKVSQLLHLERASSSTLDQWLRDEFFEQHCTLFLQRPFIWHVWDGRADGFAALLNYHKLDRRTLESLIYTYLGDWIARQEEATRAGDSMAEARLIAARMLQGRLKLVLDGEPPYDVFVRWKPLHEQPIGWEPDLNDGVRINIWPFVNSAVLRKSPNIKWNKDRGRNPPRAFWGEERWNRYEDIPSDQRPAQLRSVEKLTTAIRREARAVATARTQNGIHTPTASIRS